MDHIVDIPVFVAVVNHGGFSAAARQLGITKAAISKRIVQLEQHLGAQLLHRTTRKLSLTEAGRRYFEYAQIALQAAQEAEDVVTQLQGEPKGLLKINAPMSFGRLHVAPLIPEFLLRFPQVHIDLVMDDRVVDLVQNGFDLAIRAGELPSSTLIMRKLVPARSVICAAPVYLKKHGLPKTPEELVDHNCVLYSYSNKSNEWALFNPDHTCEVVVTGNYQVNNSEALLEGLLKGLGIGRLPTFIAGPHLKSGQLINVFPTYQMPVKSIYAVLPERAFMPAKVRVFLDFVVDHFGKETPYWD